MEKYETIEFGMKFLREGHGVQALLTGIKENHHKYDGQNKGIIKLKFKSRRPMGHPTRWFCHVPGNGKRKTLPRNHKNHEEKRDWRCPCTDQYKTLLEVSPNSM
jgi:hypothetical protein